MSVNFTLLRQQTVSLEYFKAFPRLKTLMSCGIRLDPDVSRWSRGLERGMALHIHETRDELIAHQWAYNGLTKQEIRRDSLASLSPNTGGEISLREYDPASDNAGPEADRSCLTVFHLCLEEAKSKLCQSHIGTYLELDKIRLSFSPYPSQAATALECGVEKLGLGTKYPLRLPVDIDFNNPPLVRHLILRGYA